MTYGQHLPLYIRFGRSSLARSDTAGSTITKTHPPRVNVFRPPRIDLACRMGIGKSRLVDTSQWRTPLVHGRSILARSDTASSAMQHSPFYESMVRPTRSPIFKPPRADVASRIGKRKGRLVDSSQWRTPLVFGRSILARSDTASSTIQHSPFYESMARPTRSPIFKPPRADVASRIGKWKSRLVDSSQWRTPLVHGRSILARSDTASSAMQHSPFYESMICPTRSALFRPPRADLASRIGKWKSRLVDSSQWRTPLVHGRSILARSDTASSVMKHSPLSASRYRISRSFIHIPLWGKCIRMNEKWRNTLVKILQGCTPSVPECNSTTRMDITGMLSRYILSRWFVLHPPSLSGSTPSVRIVNRPEYAMRYRQWRSATV